MPVLKKFSRLQGLSLFDNYSHVADVPEFARYNLVYGFNGSGKTTLSRLLRHLEVGALPTDWAANARFSIELDDGSDVSESANMGAMKDRLFVFNVDFVDEHLNWKDGKASPIFYIGKAQADLAEQLRLKETERDKIKSEVATAKELVDAQDQRFAGAKRDAARVIASELNLGRSYNATNLESDYANWVDDPALILAAETRDHLRATLSMPEPRPKLASLPTQTGTCGDIGQRLSALLAKTIGIIALDEIRDHPSMLSWFQTGLEYHSAKSLGDCLFCGNTLPEDRLAVLASAIDDRFDKLMSEIKSAREEIDSRREECRRVRAAIPSKGALAPGLESGYDDLTANLAKSLDEADAVFRLMLAVIEKKQAEPNTAVAVPDELLPLQLEEIDSGLLAGSTAVRDIIAKHNQTHDAFEQSKGEAASKLKAHLLQEGSSGFRDVKAANDSAATKEASLVEALAKIEAEAVVLRGKIREHGPAAEALTKGVKAYLGHDYLEVRAEDGEEGYRIYRRGVAVNGCLSEGEKTAIALTYFLSRLTAENRQLKDLVVVIDDPVSSLDSRALNYAFNLLRNALADAAQVVILTHNLSLMNEIKKWLRRKVGKGEAAWLMMDCHQDAAGDRKSRLAALPKLLAEHESEYHYLFKLTHDFASDNANHHPYLYLMPNALRKVLEIFLTFKFPNVRDIVSLVEHAEAAGGDKLDPARWRALERLSQIESHGDNLDDLVSMSSMTLEETRGAALALINMIEAVDGTHFAGMKKLCA